MQYLLDTDICSAYLRGVGSVINRMQLRAGRVHVSVISLGELLGWTLRKNTPEKYRQGVAGLLSQVTVTTVDDPIARRFGEVRAEMLDRGLSVAPLDLFIAATALVHGFVVVTHNVKHFQLVPNLPVEDWSAP